ncbi:ATPase [Aureococcus anophagefferens]|nr:ATPase [Aureococcus anophagefferens]
MAAIVASVLAGLDEDLQEYIVGLCDDTDDDDDLKEAVAAFVLSSELVEEEDAAEAKAAELLEALGRGKPKVDEAALKKAAQAERLARARAAFASVFGGGDETSTAGDADAAAADDAAAKPKREKKERKPKKAPIAKEDKTSVAFKKRALDAEMEAARVRACRSRWRLGAYRGDRGQGLHAAQSGGGRELLDDAAFTLVRGRRYALIGRNGKGKSTLLLALAARRVGDVPEACSVHYVSQDQTLSAEDEERTPGSIVLDADVERRVLLADREALDAKLSTKLSAKDAADCGELRQTLERLESVDADSAPRRAELLKHLGFSDGLRGKKMRELSGGWRVRTNLAAALFARPDLLLLDEPTNHLSIAAVLWLARELATSETWKERIVVTARRAEQLLNWRRVSEKRQAEVDTLKYAGHGFRYGGSQSQIKKMQMKAKQASKLEEEQSAMDDEFAALNEDQELPLELQHGGELPGNLVALKDVGFAYPGGDFLFRNAEMGIDTKSRVVFLGENGNGKTTLVKIIMGDLEPTEGECLRSPHARVALVNQHHADQIDLKQTPLQFMMAKFPGPGTNDHALKLRSHLAKCGVTGHDPDLQNVPAAALSGGQRSRVALAAVSYVAPHVLIMDEPTNNLDLESVAALADCVKRFEGAVVVVSHDQYFVNEIADEAWVVNKGAVRKAKVRGRASRSSSRT